MSEEETINFKLGEPVTNNYANRLIIDMENYKYWADRRFETGVHIHHGETALNHLLGFLFVKGREFMKQAYPELKDFGVLDIDRYLSVKARNEDQEWEILDEIYNKAKEWIDPNILELRMNVGKPAYSTEGHLGNKPR
jgi:hypothetical protein